MTDRYEAARNALAAYSQPERDGTIHAAVIAALWDRADYGSSHGEPNTAASAAQWVEGDPDGFWDEFAGPMLDDIERKFL